MRTPISRSLRNRILAIVLVPCFGFAVFAAHDLFRDFSILSLAAENGRRIEVNLDAGRVVQELQKERGLSALFLGAERREYGAELKRQRDASDLALQKLQDTVAARGNAHSSGQALVTSSLRSLADVSAKRDGIDKGAIAPPESFAYYTKAILGFIEAIMLDQRDVSDAPIASALDDYATIAKLKEFSGQERATLATASRAGKLDLASYARFSAMVESQKRLAEQYLLAASPAGKAALETAFRASAVSNVERMRKIALEAGPDKALTGLSPTDWWAESTARIDLLKTVEDKAAEAADQLGRQLYDRMLLDVGIDSGSVLGILLGALWIALRISRGMIVPLTGLTAVTMQLSEGKLDADVPAVERQDEIGRLARAVAVLKTASQEARRLQAAHEAEEIAKEQRRTLVEGLISGFDGAVGHSLEVVGGSVLKMEAAAGQMAVNAQDAESRLTTVSETFQNNNGSMQSVASAVEELSASVSEITRQVAESANVAKIAADSSARATSTADGLRAAAQKVGDVVKLISDVAAKTNLLALNATIEASRAGEAGKGFAVVANEVKALATQTGKATKEISDQIETIQHEVQESAAAITEIADVVMKIDEISTLIASAVEEQGIATKEIARNIEQVAASSNAICNNINDVTTRASETREASSHVQDAATFVNKEAMALQEEVRSFLTQVKAA